MKYCFPLFLIFIMACHQKNKKSTGANAYVNTVPEIRDTIHKDPVASYSVPMGDPRLDRKFGVEIYETNFTFKYLLVMQYDAMIQTDTLKLPDFGMWPAVEVKPGNENLSCIIGFLDKQNNFREYKMLSAKNDQLKLTVLKSYGISGY